MWPIKWQRRWNFAAAYSGRRAYVTIGVLIGALIFLVLWRVRWPTRRLNGGPSAGAVYERLCSDYDLDSKGRRTRHDGRCLGPFHNIGGNFRTADKYKMLTCHIEKNLSTVLTAITCLLHNETAYIAANRTITEDMYEGRFCKRKNEFIGMLEVQLKYRYDLADWTMITVVREPIARFLSGFIDKCVIKHEKQYCYDCNGTDIHCFVDRLYERAQKFADGTLKKPLWLEDTHTFPQNWNCDFGSTLSRFHYLRYDERDSQNAFAVQLDDALAWAGVEAASRGLIADQLAAGRTSHSTRGAAVRDHYAKIIDGDPALKRKIVQTFYYDYVLFGFDIPSSVLDVD